MLVLHDLNTFGRRFYNFYHMFHDFTCVQGDGAPRIAILRAKWAILSVIGLALVSVFWAYLKNG